MSEAKPLRPAFVDEEIILSLRLGGQWSERGVDHVIAKSVDIVAAGQADVIGPHLDAEVYVRIT